jgi:hypothetical protein
VELADRSHSIGQQCPMVKAGMVADHLVGVRRSAQADGERRVDFGTRYTATSDPSPAIARVEQLTEFVGVRDDIAGLVDRDPTAPVPLDEFSHVRGAHAVGRLDAQRVLAQLD